MKKFSKYFGFVSIVVLLLAAAAIVVVSLPSASNEPARLRGDGCAELEAELERLDRKYGSGLHSSEWADALATVADGPERCGDNDE